MPGERIFEIMDAPVEVQGGPGAAPLPAAGEIRFEDVAPYGRGTVCWTG